MKKQMFVALLSAAISTLVVEAAVRVEVGPDLPGGIPAYARLAFGPDLLLHTEEWAAVVFYRDPTCVPEDFNLVAFFDPPPRPFGCSLTVEGFEIWETWPPPPPPAPPISPMVTELQGRDVPVWFVPWPDLQVAIVDGVLTVPELEALPTLQKGSASFFQETLQSRSIVQGIHLGIIAHGRLEDGRSFQYKVQALQAYPHTLGNRTSNIRIDFE